MTQKIQKPWRRDTNSKYSEVVKGVIGLSTASLLLPVFLAREFLGIDAETPLTSVLDCSVYFAWGLLSLSIIAGIFYQYLSAKWLRFAWGKEAGIFGSSSTKESKVELCMEVSFWLCILLFGAGLFFTIYFFASYASGI